ncbi:cob(I)yrinic acid a,c-diamide adenosyltransferase [Mesotoga sp.]|uniref:cob(I)yrinic acid a,c-diamide adenosyltransferase n=1 Tax=Mesotoga sp. TaxID=2053577 RepID=UPI001BD379D5|nr:cob(I)yrinic acid a,c-diamide adenosyltransferase [Mesotoga sp.]
MEKGYIHIYTGNGKGKTTAAIGLAIRACMAGERVFIGQFIKGIKYSEQALSNYINGITIEQFGRKCFIRENPEVEDLEAARTGLARSRDVLRNERFGVVILDEIFIACHYRLVTVEDITKLFEMKPSNVELVLTGRNAPAEIFEKADLVTEMREIKHYYHRGVEARKGIEY